MEITSSVPSTLTLGLLQTRIGSGSVLTHKAQGFTVGVCESIGRGGGGVHKSLSGINLQRQARPSRQRYNLSPQVRLPRL